MATSIADLFVSVSADVSSATAGLTVLGTSLSNTTNEFNKAAPAALAFVAAGAGIGAFFVSSISTAADFEQQMSGVNAVLDPADVETFGASLSDLALTLGRDTVFTSRQAAAGIEELVKAGIPAQAILDGAAQGATNLAAATGISVNQAATIAATSMNAFGHTTEQLGGDMDLLAGVANASATDISGLGNGISIVGATAHSAGFDLSDIAVAIGVLSNAGIDGANAGTALRQMLLELSPTTKPAQEEMRKLGLITADGKNQFFDASGKIRSMAEVSQILQNSLRGLSPEMRTAALNTLFTRDAINAASILATQGSAGFEKLADAAGQITTAEAAKTRLDNLRGSLQNLGGSFETVQITVGNFFLPVIRSLADAARAPLDAFSKMEPQAKRVATAILAISGGAFELVGGLVLLSPLLNAIIPSFTSLLGILVKMSPMFLLIAGVVGLLSLAWQTNFLGIQDVTRKFVDDLPSILGGIGVAFDQATSGDVLGALGTLTDILVGEFPGLQGAVDTFRAILGNIAVGIGPIAESFRAGLVDMLTTMTPILQNLGLVFQKLFAGDFAGAFDTFRAIIGAVSPEVGKALTAAGDVGAQVGPKIGNVAAVIGAGFGAIAAGVGPVILDFFQNKLPVALNAFGEQIQSIGPTLAIAGQFFGAFGQVLDSLTVTKAQAASDAFASGFGASLANFAQQVEPFVGVFQAIGNFATGLSSLIAAFNGLKGASAGADTTASITDPLSQFLDFFISHSDQFVTVEGLLGPIGPAFALIRDNGAGLAQVLNDMAAGLNSLAAAVSNLPPLPEWMQTLLSQGLLGGVSTLVAPIGQAGFNARQGNISAGGPDSGALTPNVGAMIQIGTLVVSDEAQRKTFLEEMAAMLAEASKRVAIPVDNSGNPALAAGT